MQYIVSDGDLERYYNSKDVAVCHSWQYDEFENIDSAYLSDLICKLSANGMFLLCISLKTENIVERHLDFEKLFMRKLQVECGVLAVWMDKYVDNATRIGLFEIDRQYLPAMLAVLHRLPWWSFGLVSEAEDRIKDFLILFEQSNCAVRSFDIMKVATIAKTVHVSLLHTICGNDGRSINLICPL